MIIETIVTTLNEDGTTNIAPMGPVVNDSWNQFVLRPFKTSLTYANLLRTGEGIVHITDDVDLIARAAVGQLDRLPNLEAGKKVGVQAVANSCRWFEFRVLHVSDFDSRADMNCQTVFSNGNRDFLGFCRAKHAILEGAILATRLGFIPFAEIDSQFRRFEIIVSKTGSPQDIETFRWLHQFVFQSNSIGDAILQHEPRETI